MRGFNYKQHSKGKIMNISKLHPVGYEAKTEQGNTYKKSNIYKTIALSSATALNILPYCHAPLYS